MAKNVFQTVDSVVQVDEKVNLLVAEIRDRIELKNFYCVGDVKIMVPLNSYPTEEVQRRFNQLIVLFQDGGSSYWEQAEFHHTEGGDFVILAPAKV